MAGEGQAPYPDPSPNGVGVNPSPYPTPYCTPSAPLTPRLRCSFGYRSYYCLLTTSAMRQGPRIRGTDSWLDDKNLGSDLPLLLNCTKFGQLTLRKIIKIVATGCQILRLKCTKFDFGWGSALDPAGGAYRPIAGFKGAYF